MRDRKLAAHNRLITMQYEIGDTITDLANLYRGAAPEGRFDLPYLVGRLKDLTEIAREYAPSALEYIEKYNDKLRSAVRPNASRPTASATVASLKEKRSLIPDLINALYGLQVATNIVHRGVSTGKKPGEVKIRERNYAASLAVIVGLVGIFFGMYSIVSLQEITGKVFSVNSVFASIIGLLFLLSFFAFVLAKKFLRI